MKLSNSQRDKRIFLILIPAGIIFSVLAAMSGDSMFLFTLISVGSLSVLANLVRKNNWYISSSVKDQGGSFRLFPLIQLAILVPVVVLCLGLGFLAVSMLEKSL